MLHISRDFITLGNVYPPQVTVYLHALFLRTVLNYVVVGQTGFNLDSSTFTVASGVAGTISAASGFTNRFTPDGYTVSAADINRILVIRSTSYPLLNSGIWRVTGIDTVNNQFVLGLRGEPPVASTGMSWRLHVAENSFSFPNGANANTGQYRGRTSGATTARIIMQAPHSTAYQVRLTYETSADLSTTGNVRCQSGVAPGIGGDINGDFAVGGPHLHAGLFYNVAPPNSNAAGLTVGINPTTQTGMIRYYMWGEDTTGTVVTVTRSVDVGADGWCAFGLPEDEEYPNDPQVVRRLFAWGSAQVNFPGTGILGWRNGPVQAHSNFGVTFGYSGQPISCTLSTYCFHAGQQGGSNFDAPRYSSFAADSPFLSMTELQTVDLLAGTWDHGLLDGQAQVLFYEPRRLGRFPIARLGRTNFGRFTVTTDTERNWLHTSDGIYLPWYGSILP